MDDAQRVRSQLHRLPIFPLPGAVLLPYALIPLHVFEPRYRKLIRDCQSGAGVLALANIPAEARRERKDPPRVLPVIGAGILARVDPLPDGRSDIAVRGVLRARILEELSPQEPYRIVRAVPLADIASDLDVARRQALARMAGSTAEPGELADAIGAMVIEAPQERQQLLEITSPEERLRRVSQQVLSLLAQTQSGRGTLPN